MFSTLEKDHPDILEIYEEHGHKMSTICQRYAYYLASQLGMKKEWRGLSLQECHQTIKDKKSETGEGGISRKNYKIVC